MTDTPQFNFNELTLEYKVGQRSFGQLETKVEKIRVFTMA